MESNFVDIDTNENSFDLIWFEFVIVCLQNCVFNSFPTHFREGSLSNIESKVLKWQ